MGNKICATDSILVHARHVRYHKFTTQWVRCAVSVSEHCSDDSEFPTQTSNYHRTITTLLHTAIFAHAPQKLYTGH